MIGQMIASLDLGMVRVSLRRGLLHQLETRRNN